MGKLKTEYVQYFDEMHESGMFTADETITAFSGDFIKPITESRKLYYMWKSLQTLKIKEHE